MDTKKTIEQIARSDGRYHPDALRFVYEGLGVTVRKLRDQNPHEHIGHITGEVLAKGLGELASERWGRLAKTVLENWNVKSTRDFGNIVYLMIENHWMSAQPSDKIEDFDDVYDFETVFEKQFKITC